MTSPVVPPRSEPMPMNRAPRNARRTAVFSAFLISFTYFLSMLAVGLGVRVRYHCNASTHRDVPGMAARSVVVAGVEVDARDALGAEHLDVAAVVLDRQCELEAVAAQVPDRRLLEVAGEVVVAPRAA